MLNLSVCVCVYSLLQMCDLQLLTADGFSFNDSCGQQTRVPTDRLFQILQSVSLQEFPLHSSYIPIQPQMDALEIGELVQTAPKYISAKLGLCLPPSPAPPLLPFAFQRHAVVWQPRNKAISANPSTGRQEGDQHHSDLWAPLQLLQDITVWLCLTPLIPSTSGLCITLAPSQKHINGWILTNTQTNVLFWFFLKTMIDC